MQITFLQTSDPFVYYPMLQETSKTTDRLCVHAVQIIESAAA